MKELHFIKTDKTAIYLDCIDEYEIALRNQAKNSIITVHARNSPIWKAVLKLILTLGRFWKFKLPKVSKKTYFSMLMGPCFEQVLPYALASNNVILYLYDAWPRFIPYINQVAELLDLKIIYFSSEEVTRRFNLVNKKQIGKWLPEGIRLESYRFLKYENKDIDVIEFGRKFDKYHNIIKEVLKQNGKCHLYEKVKGEVVFPDRMDFVDALSRSKISICIPSNITHPERSEDISSMTLRYLQSMASKCLIVGILPYEMKGLFKYNPIIEINDDPGKQILNILENYESFLPLIEKNYQNVLASHTWNVRLAEMYNAF